ncbi:hypothetical protein AAFF_G00420800 [Aldrovandia affinis]|uniref:La-related protein 6 n=1 Tax=Aldrovandia affinis TaxID=143900 RepID=A0AAD7S9M8_9TELE|nr:hypothetical protein AAFF_G00420800 [Aldrovandia affinis]
MEDAVLICQQSHYVICCWSPLLTPLSGVPSTIVINNTVCVSSLSASPAPPQGSPWGTIWELWQAVERNFWDLFAIQPRRLPHNPYHSSRATSTEKSYAAAENELGVIVCEDEGGNTLGREALVSDSMSAAMELPSSVESVSDSARLGGDGAVTDRQVQEMGTQVTITVAIQAAEDEEPSEVLSSNHLDFHGGSCSEDEVGRHDKSSGAGTSGGELEEESWQPPDPELTQKLVAQIEYYLSDENLEHDAFLLKHVRRNKMGFVSVKLLTSFKKVKHLTRDWRTTAYALRQSALLELNEEGRKGRGHWGGTGGRQQRGRAAQQDRLMEVLLRAFGTFGPIASVRVLKSGKEVPPDLKKLSSRYTQLGTEECAIVEFEEVEAAVKAHEAMGGEAEGGGGAQGLKVVLIGTKPPKKKVPKDRQRVGGGGESAGMRKSRSLNSRVRELQYLGDDSACSSSETESNPTSPRQARKARSTNKLSPTGGGVAYQQNNHLSPGVSPRSSPWSSPRASPCAQRKSLHGQKSPLASEGRLSPEAGRRWADYSSDSSLTPSGSPWVQRRRQVASQESSPVGSPMLGRKIQNADGLPPGVVRLPRGPDGTRGFTSASAGQRGTAANPQT